MRLPIWLSLTFVVLTASSVFGQFARQTLSFAASFSTTRTVYGPSVALDRAGNIYLAGEANSNELPADVPGLRTKPGSGCGYVLKLNPTASRVEYASYFGCFGTRVNAIAVDAAGSAYLTGQTLASTDFPIVNPVAPRQKVDDDAFVLKLSPDGTRAEYSTTIGGFELDEGLGIALDGSGSAYVTGLTRSGDFPVRSAFQSSSGSPPRNCGIFACQTIPDAFVLRLAANGSLVYSTYLGGSGTDLARGIAVDEAGNAYITGETESANFPLRSGGYLTSCAPVVGLPCITSTFVVKLSPSGNSLTYATLLSQGGSRGSAIALDSARNAWVTGQGQVRPTFTETSCDNCAFVSKLSPDGASVLYSANLNDAGGRGIAVDAEGTVYLSGSTLTGDASAVRIANSGGAPFRLYLGPGWGTGIATNGVGSVIVAGYGLQGFYPSTPGAVRINGCEETICGYVFVAGMDTRSQPALIVPQLLPQGVVNAASVEAGPIAPGEIVTAYGAGFGAPGFMPGSADPNGRVATTLGDTSIVIGGIKAPLLYVAPGQLSAVVPFLFTNVRAVPVYLVNQGVRSQPSMWTVAVQESAPALFTTDQSGSGPAVVLNEDGSLNEPGHPATTGSIIVLYGTGGGQTDPPGNENQLTRNPPPKLKLPVTIRIGGLDAEVLYAGGVAGQTPGLIQINVRVPANTPAGRAPVELTVGSTAGTRQVTVFVAARP